MFIVLIDILFTIFIILLLIKGINWATPQRKAVIKEPIDADRFTHWAYGNDNYDDDIIDSGEYVDLWNKRHGKFVYLDKKTFWKDNYRKMVSYYRALSR